MIHLDFDQYSVNELRDLNRRLVEHLRLKHQRNSQQAMNRFNLGDRVCFEDTYGEIVEGKIIRFNQKTVTIEHSNGHQWRVSPQLLERVIESQKVKTVKPATPVIPQIVVNNSDRPISKNALCPCGSGKKYKRCCLPLESRPS